jgi:hypothetical protein
MPLVATELSLPIRCIIRTDSPPYLPTIYNNDFQIYQSRLCRDCAGDDPQRAHDPARGRPHLGKNLHQWLGDTRGHFEGNTLVIETTNFRTDDGTVYQGANRRPTRSRSGSRASRTTRSTTNSRSTTR